MKIFISWSGQRSEVLAKALREWFPLVLHYVEPWLSQSDIQAGERWSVEIAKELESSNFGVICVTKENMNSPWILFEAGALAKSMQDGRVVPLLLDLDFKEISGPLVQFQAKKAEVSGIKELVNSLNKASPSPIPDAQLDRLFSALWVDFEKQVSSIPKSSIPEKKSRPQDEILEELVAGVRSVDLKVRDIVGDDSSIGPKKRSKMSYEFVRYLMDRVAEGPGDPTILLIICSMFRDDLPWLYELGMDAYRSAKGGRLAGTVSLRRFRGVLEAIMSTPIAEELGIDRSILNLIRRDLVRHILLMEEAGVGVDRPTIRPAVRRQSTGDGGTT